MPILQTVKYFALYFAHQFDCKASVKTLKWISFSAPGSYDVEKAERTIHQSSGAISFGIKYKDQKIDNIPGKQIVI